MQPITISKFQLIIRIRLQTLVYPGRSVYNYFTGAYNNVLSHELTNMTTHVILYSLIDISIYV